jgi:hypothetical protein
MTYQLIQTQTLGSAAALISFTSIPQDATDLFFSISGRATASNPGFDRRSIFMSLNGTGTTGVSGILLEGFGASVSSSSATRLGFVPSPDATANTFGSIGIYIPNYTVAINKSISIDAVTENNTTTDGKIVIGIAAQLWANTAAITSATFTVESSGDWAAGSTISLYKITRGSSGGVVVS